MVADLLELDREYAELRAKAAASPRDGDRERVQALDARYDAALQEFLPASAPGDY